MRRTTTVLNDFNLESSPHYIEYKAEEVVREQQMKENLADAKVTIRENLDN
jgi:hypothetical protein